MVGLGAIDQLPSVPRTRLKPQFLNTMDSEKREKRYKCDECSSAFTYPYLLKSHKSSVHSELRPFQCEHCDYRGKTKAALREHLATHFPQTYKTHSCPQCPYKCIKPGQLLTHFKVKHRKEKPFPCKICPYRASHRTALTVHMRSHTRERPFKCSVCPLTFSQPSNLHRHKVFVHNRNDVSLIACTFPGCARKFTVKHSLRRHVESFHKKETRFSCPYCEKSFYEQPHCVSHIRHRHTKERPYKCSVCEYAAATSQETKSHERTTHGEYMGLECRICQRKYKNKRSLASHHILYHKNADRSKEAPRKWKCEESGCSKEYKARHGLMKHVSSFHLQQRPFKCLYCGHKTTTSFALNEHLKTHTGEKPYRCDLCKQFFTSSRELRTHKATAHSELRPFECDQCSFSTKTKDNLKQHVVRHERMQIVFECSICKESQRSLTPRDYSFLSKSSLNVHIREQHFNEGSSKSLLSPPGSKGVAVPKTEPRCLKVIHTASDCPPCFVRLVLIKELQRESTFKTSMNIYA